ncbi:MAG: hypothetical protein COA90_03680 [Gammaproteobacteria bacterium]|nr:MAG: hypothetical protein COA90_03680 [Gammaproteobacteria bacterium]
MERIFRSLKTESVPPSMGYMSFKQTKLDIGRYLMGYYNYQISNTFNLDLPPAIAEEKLFSSVWN